MEEVGSPGGIGGSPWEKMGGGGSMMGVHRDGWERSMSQTGAVTQSEIFHTCCMLLIDIPFTNYELLWIESEFNIPRWLTVPADIYKVLMGVLLSTMLAIEVYVILLAEKELPYNVRLLGVCGVCVVLHSTRVNTAVQYDDKYSSTFKSQSIYVLVRWCALQALHTRVRESLTSEVCVCTFQKKLSPPLNVLNLSIKPSRSTETLWRATERERLEPRTVVPAVLRRQCAQHGHGTHPSDRHLRHLAPNHDLVLYHDRTHDGD